MDVLERARNRNGNGEDTWQDFIQKDGRTQLQWEIRKWGRGDKDDQDEDGQTYLQQAGKQQSREAKDIKKWNELE